MSAKGTAQYDLVICGAGLVGLALATALADSFLKVLVVDRQPAPAGEPAPTPLQDGHKLVSGYAGRVSALNQASVSALIRADVWPKVGRHCAFSAMHVVDGRGSADIRFDAKDIGQTSLGVTVENPLVIGALHSRLEAATNIELRFNTSIDELDQADSGIEMVINGDPVTCDLLVGADGGQSQVRKLAHLNALSWPYDQQAIVTTIRTVEEHEGVARQWFTEEGPLAFLPLAEPNLCSVVWSVNDADALLGLDDADFCAALEFASEWLPGGVVACDRRLAFPLFQQQAYRYVKPGIALIGDAAHTIHPLAGQGANLGIADAVVLATELKQLRFTGERAGDIGLLRRYVRKRQPHNVTMALAMEAFKRLYATDNVLVNWARNLGLRHMDQAGPVKAVLARFASGQ